MVTPKNAFGGLHPRGRHLPLACVVVLLAGCWHPSTVIIGLVTLDNTPVADATLEFFPLSGIGRVSVAHTDASGRYTATVSPTDLRVVITAMHVVGKSPHSFAPGAESMDDVRSSLPKKYGHPDTTPLVARPVEAATTTIDFPLMSASNKN